jgi:hypothetical protein
MPTGSWRELRGARRLLGLAAVAALMTTGCITVSSAGSTGGSAGGSAFNSYSTIFVQKFRYHGAPKALKAGVHSFLFENRESFPITHEMIPIALPAGKTSTDVTDAAKATGPDSEDEWLHIGGDFGPADTGASVLETLYLPPGTYAFACWQTGTATGGDNGPPHVAIGMVWQFTVTS